MLALYIIAATLLIILFLLFKKFILTILYENNIVVVKVRILGRDIKFYRTNLEEKPPESKPKKKFSFREVWGKIKKYRRVYRDQKSNVLLILSKAARAAKLHSYRFDIEYGFGNAAITGIAYGAIYGVAIAADKVFRNAFGYRPDSALKVSPNYNVNKFDATAEFVVTTRIASLIELCLYTLKIYRREKTRILNILEDD